MEMESVEDILSAQPPTANLEVYKDSFAPQPPSRRVKAWERAPRAASAPRLQGQKIWKRPGLRSHENKENIAAAQAELIKGGTGSRKRARIQGAKEDIREAKWADEFAQSNDTELFCNIGEGTRLSVGFGDSESLMVPRKRTNANHLVTPRKALRKRPSNESNQIVLSPVKVLEDAPEKPVRRRASMRQSIRRLTVESGDIDAQAAVAFSFESPSGATRNSVRLTTSHNILPEDTAAAQDVEATNDVGSDVVEPAREITPPPKVFEGNLVSSIKQQKPSLMQAKPSKFNTQDTPMITQLAASTITPEIQIEEPELEISEEEQIAEQLYATSPVKRPVTLLDEASVPAQSRRRTLAHVLMENKLEGPITPISKKTRRTSKARWTNERPATRRSTRSSRSSLFTINQETMLIEQVPEPVPEAPSSSTPENHIQVSVREVMPTPQAVMQSEVEGSISPETDDIAIPINFDSAVVHGSEAPSTDDDEMIWSGKGYGESEAPEDTKMAEEQDNDHSHMDESKSFENTLVFDHQEDDDQARIDESEALDNTEFDQQDSEENGHFEDNELEVEHSVASSEIGDDLPHTPNEVNKRDEDEFSQSSPTPSGAEDSPTMNDLEQITPSKTASSPISDVDDTVVLTLEGLEPISMSLEEESPNMATDENLDTVMEDITIDTNGDVNPQEQKQNNYDPDDTNVLLDFLNRHANKAGKAPRKRSLPHSPLRLPLADASETAGSASPEAEAQPEAEAKDEFDVSVVPAEKPNKRRRRNSHSQNDTDLTEPPTSIRRSGRTRLPVVKSSQLPAPSSIPFRRLGQDSTVTIQQSKEKELAALTRMNTRKNKGGALYPLELLAKKDEKGDIPARQRALKEVFDEKARKKGKEAKNVIWAEVLEHFSDGKKVEVGEEEEEKQGKEKAPFIVVKKKKAEGKENKVVVEEKEQPSEEITVQEKKVVVVEEKEKKTEAVEKKRSSIPRVSRSKIALGMAPNGTPAPKRRAKRS